MVVMKTGTCECLLLHSLGVLILDELRQGGRLAVEVKVIIVMPFYQSQPNPLLIKYTWYFENLKVVNSSLVFLNRGFE